MTTVLSKLFSLRRRTGALMDYDEAKRLAADGKTAVRRKLAGRDDVQPEILYYLAEDDDAEVRRAAAANAAIPVQADLVLTGDGDADVRCRVARKVAALAPNLSAEERDRVGGVTQVLCTLASDQLARVRRIVSEELKEAHDAPPEVIERLARDHDIPVAGPVLESSPLLGDELLLEIIHSAPIQGALSAISRRHGLGQDVSDAIVEADDRDTVTALLNNASAQIREETLDRIVERAETVGAWHEPLVTRPKLSIRSVRLLAEFVADSLVVKLQQRSDIDPQTARALSAATRDRLESEPGDATDDELTEEARAEALFAQGELDEKAVNAALDRGERGFVVAALALKAGLSRSIAQKAVSMASAKGVTALSWKAGFSMRLALQLQLRLARIAPSTTLKPAGDDYPLTPDEMNWQIEFFSG